jgi:hypothetical protein
MKFILLLAACLAQGNAKGKGVGNASPKGVGNGNRPPKDNVSAGITYSGTGCPPGSASVALAEDRSSFTILFSRFIASNGSPTDNRKDCMIDVDLVYPEEWSFAIQAIDYRGYAQLPAGMSAVHRSQFLFQGNGSPNARTSLVGPLNEDYFIREEQPLEFSKCRTRMKGRIRTVLQLNGSSTQPAQMTVDSVDQSVIQTYTIQWKKC